MNNPGQTDFSSMCKRQGKRGLSLIVHYVIGNHQAYSNVGAFRTLARSLPRTSSAYEEKQ